MDIVNPRRSRIANGRSHGWWVIHALSPAVREPGEGRGFYYKCNYQIGPHHIPDSARVPEKEATRYAENEKEMLQGSRGCSEKTMEDNSYSRLGTKRHGGILGF